VFQIPAIGIVPESQGPPPCKYNTVNTSLYSCIRYRFHQPRPQILGQRLFLVGGGRAVISLILCWAVRALTHTELRAV